MPPLLGLSAWSHVYDSIAFVYPYALDHEPPLCTESPCRLSTKQKGELPAKRDKDPRWRKGARRQRWQIESLLAAPREKVPLDRLIPVVEGHALASSRALHGVQPDARSVAERVIGELFGWEFARGAPAHERTLPAILTRLLPRYLAGDPFALEFPDLAPSPVVDACLGRLVAIARSEFEASRTRDCAHPFTSSKCADRSSREFTPIPNSSRALGCCATSHRSLRRNWSVITVSAC